MTSNGPCNLGCASSALFGSRPSTARQLARDGRFSERIGADSKRICRSEAGFSLIELLVVCALMFVVLAALLSLLDGASGQAAKDQERGHAIREAQQGLGRMATELRHAYRVEAASLNSVAVLVRCRRLETDCASTGATRRSKRVRFNCNAPFTGRSSNPNAAAFYRVCSRAASKTPLADGSCCTAPSGSELVIDRVLNAGATYADATTCKPPPPPTAGPVFVYRRRDASNDLVPTCAGTSAHQVDVTVSVPAQGERRKGYDYPVTLRDGVALPNVQLRTP